MRSAINYPALDPNDGGPAVGVPFIGPDFGTRIVRATDEADYYGTSVGVANTVSGTNSSAEAYSCSRFNAALGIKGGYICWFYTGGGGWGAFTLDATTMQIQQLTPSGWSGGSILSLGEPSTSWTDPWVTFIDGPSLQIKAYGFPAQTGFPGTPANDPFVGNTVGSGVVLFTASSSTCPNLPSGASGALSELQADSTDTQFSGYANGRYIIYFNKARPTVQYPDGACDWYDTVTNNMGGTDFSGVQKGTTWIGLAQPPSITALTPTTGTGSLAAGTYCFSETLIGVNVTGAETEPGPISCVALSATGEFSVPRPPLPTDGSSNAYMNGSSPYGWNAYGCLEPSPPTQCTPNSLQNASITAWATTTVTVSSLASGAAPPATNSSGFTIHQARLAPNGSYEFIVNQNAPNGSLEIAWQIPNGVPSTAIYYFAAVEAHTVAANNFATYQNGGGSNGYGAARANMSCMQALNFKSTPVTISSPNCSGIASNYTALGDTHPSIADDTAAANDRLPACGSSAPFGVNVLNWSVQKSNSITSIKPNGTTVRFPQTGYNPDWSTMEPLNGEIYCWAMDGSNKIWRFVHTRTSGWPYNSSSAVYGTYFYPQYGLATMTRDGKFMIFSSSWDWNLGTHGHAGWQPNMTYSSGAIVNDSNGNLETAQSAFTSGMTIPVWSTTVGSLTPDGHWKMSLGCPTAAACRWDVFVAELR